MKGLIIPEHVQGVVEAIRYAGGHTYLAGGAVRDNLLGIRSSDFDLEVYDLGSDELIQALLGLGNVDTVGQSFGIIMLHRPGYPPVEIALPRRENKQGRGHKGFMVEVDPTMSTFEATRRRDFTMNSMLLDLHTGELIDHHGGMEDLTCRILRATSEAYMEDPLRVLRGFQFIARFGLTATKDTINMSIFMLNEARTLSVERVWGEWYKWATLGEYYILSLEFLRDTDWIRLYPELEQLKGIKQDPVWHPEGDVWTHTKIVLQNASDLANQISYFKEPRVQLIFAALLHDIGKGTTSEISKTSGRIIHPKHEVIGVDLAKKFLENIGAPLWVGVRALPMIREHMFRRGRNPETISKRAIRRLAVRLEPATIHQLGVLINADAMDRIGNIDPFVRSMLEVANEVNVEDSAPEKVLKGEHLIEKGLTPGPKFGVILRAAYEAQLDGEFQTEWGAGVWLEQYLHEIYLSEKE